jgi:hypothetical protein
VAYTGADRRDPRIGLNTCSMVYVQINTWSMRMYINQAQDPQFARGVAHEVDALIEATTGARSRRLRLPARPRHCVVH